MKRSSTVRLFALLIAGVYFAPNAMSQTPQSLDGVSLRVSVEGGRRQFRMGERIPLELAFSSAIPNRYHIDMARYDRSGRMNSETFDVQPHEGWSDPLADYFNSGLFAFMGGGLRGVPELGPDPTVIHLDLNEWVRFDSPGTYRLTITSDRVIVGRTEKNPGAGEHVRISSNAVEIEVTQDADWAKQQVATAIADLSSSEPEAQCRGARTLRFLGTEAAVSAMAQRFRGDEDSFDSEFMFGLIGAPERKHAVEAMEEQLADATHPITPSFLHTLALLAYRVDHPEMLRPPPPIPYGEITPEWTDWSANVKQRQVVFKEYVGRYLTTLGGGLSHRQGRNLGEALTTILMEGADADMLKQLEFRGFLDQLRSEMPRLFLQLPTSSQSSLLAFWWNQIRSVEMVPALRAMYDRTPDFRRGEYLKLIADVDPKMARDLVLQDIRRPDPTLLYDQVDVLGQELLPSLDALLATRLEESAKSGSASLRTFALLIQRHATPSIASRVEAVYASLGDVDCTVRAFLIAYLLRADFEFGKAALRKTSPSPTDANGCGARGLSYALERGSPQVERLALSRITSSDPLVATAAAESLQSSGSTVAEEHLWTALRKWHSRWDGKADQLGEPKNKQQGELGSALIEAIARGTGWLTDGGKLNELHKLCITNEQRGRVEEYQKKWETAPELEVIVLQNEVWPHIGQYEMGTLTALWPKLRQFPRGSALTVVPQYGPDQADHAQAVISEVKKFAEENGLTITVKEKE